MKTLKKGGQGFSKEVMSPSKINNINKLPPMSHSVGKNVASSKGTVGKKPNPNANAMAHREDCGMI